MFGPSTVTIPLQAVSHHKIRSSYNCAVFRALVERVPPRLIIPILREQRLVLVDKNKAMSTTISRTLMSQFGFHASERRTTLGCSRSAVNAQTRKRHRRRVMTVRDNQRFVTLGRKTATELDLILKTNAFAMESKASGCGSVNHQAVPSPPATKPLRQRSDCIVIL